MATITALEGNIQTGIPDVMSFEELTGQATQPVNMGDFPAIQNPVAATSLAGMALPAHPDYVPEEEPEVDERTYLSQMAELNEQLSQVEEEYEHKVSDADFRKEDQKLDILRSLATIPAIFAGPFAVQAVQRAITDPSKREKMKYDLAVGRLEAERKRLIKLEEQDLARQRLEQQRQQGRRDLLADTTTLNITDRDDAGNLIDTQVVMRDKDYDRMTSSFDKNYIQDTQAQANLEAAQSMYALNNVIDQIDQARNAGDTSRLNTLLTTFSASLSTVLPRLFGEVGNLSDSDKRAYTALGGEAKWLTEMVRGVFKGRKISQPELRHMIQFVRDAAVLGRNRDRNYRNKAAATALAHVSKDDRKAVHRYLINEVPVPNYAENIGVEDTIVTPSQEPITDLVD